LWHTSVRRQLAMIRLLVVEDNDDFRFIVCEMLADLDYQVFTATNGVQALAVLESQAIDIVLTDMIMPDKEGLETVREIRRKYPTIKIAAMSGGGRVNANNYLDLAKRLGASVTFEKPFRAQELLMGLERIVSERNKAP
jgi:CheY-like chemotaxis protein